MKKISVFVKDKNTLVLNEAGNQGDYIDLTDLTSVDTTAIEEAISAEKDRVYEQKLAEFKKALLVEAKLEKEQAEAKLNSKIQELEALLQKNKELGESALKAKEKANNDALRLKETEVANKFQTTINELNEKLATFEANKNLEITSINSKHKQELTEANNKFALELSAKEQAIKSFQGKIDQVSLIHKQELKNKELELDNKYKNQIADLMKNAELDKVNNQNAISKLNLEHQKEIDDTKHQYDDKIRTLEETVLGLQRQKASLGSKYLGEDLELWSTNEYLSYAQTGGLSNCVWTKDNKVIRYADEVKGSKGDFILNCYATEEHNEEELLTSILFEMKNESPDSKTKQHNSEFYSKLHENRNKKGCKYGVLVSDLDRESNELPMFRVLEYPDMYVVKPEYLMTFINIITSLTKRFVDLVLNKSKEELSLKTKKEILEEFDAIKESYLNKELDSLGKDIDDVEKQTANIINSANKINSSIEHIRLSYMQKIERKLEIYSAKLNKLTKRIEE